MPVLYCYYDMLIQYNELRCNMDNKKFEEMYGEPSLKVFEDIAEDEFAEALKILMDKKRKNNVDMKTIANEMQIAESTLSSYRNCKMSPTLSKIKMVAIYFDCPTDYLFGIIDDETYNDEQAATARITGLKKSSIAKLENAKAKKIISEIDSIISHNDFVEIAYKIKEYKKLKFDYLKDRHLNTLENAYSNGYDVSYKDVIARDTKALPHKYKIKADNVNNNSVELRKKRKVLSYELYSILKLFENIIEDISLEKELKNEFESGDASKKMPALINLLHHMEERENE